MQARSRILCTVGEVIFQKEDFACAAIIVPSTFIEKYKKAIISGIIDMLASIHLMTLDVLLYF